MGLHCSHAPVNACSKVARVVVHCTVVHCVKPWYTVVHRSTRHCGTTWYIVVHCTVLHRVPCPLPDRAGPASPLLWSCTPDKPFQILAHCSKPLQTLAQPLLNPLKPNPPTLTLHISVSLFSTPPVAYQARHFVSHNT